MTSSDGPRKGVFDAQGNTGSGATTKPGFHGKPRKVSTITNSRDNLSEITYLRFIVDSKAMQFCLPQEKEAHLTEYCKRVLQTGVVSARELAKMVGMLLATRLAVFPAPLHY